MLIRIDPSRDAPLWEQVAASVRAGIATGRIHAGERLPAAREIAASLDLNLHTVLHAYQVLRDEGLVDMRRGRGAVVTDAAHALQQLRGEVAALVARARSLGLAPTVLASLLAEIDPPPVEPPASPAPRSLPQEDLT
jgi:GntR family transcriptional regulator